MDTYHTYGLKIRSEIDFMKMKSIKSKPDVNIRLRKIEDSPSTEIISGGGNWIGKGQSDREIILCWDDIAKFKISEGSEILIDPITENFKIINLYLMGPVIATLLHQRGFLVLHASAVQSKFGIYAFLGPSGYGKSSLAALLYNKGYPIVADDILAVEFDSNNNPKIVPGVFRFKLSSSNLKSFWHENDFKAEITDFGVHLFSLNSDFSDNLKLKKIFILEKSYASNLSMLKKQDALMQLVKNSYCNTMFLGQDNARNLHQCVDLIKNTNISLLKVKHSLNSIPQLTQMLKDDISDAK